jgi:glycine/D-amino acid oxidase-like deaminating enzyme/nitrite reductase/ring-hydroxylating ferredoxin subunit
MDRTSGRNDSIWLRGFEIPTRQPLDADATCEVCVVGAGISGLTTAYLLAREGKSVIVLEDGEIGSGETGRTTAHLVNALDDHYSHLAKLHGPEGASLAADSHSRAIDRVEAIVRDEKIDCDFERLDGYLFVPPGDDRSILDEELEAAHNAGLDEVRLVDRVPWPEFDTGPALCFPRQAQFHPMKYLAGLARGIEAAGGRIYTASHAQKIEGGRDAHVTTKHGPTVHASFVVVATNTPVNDKVTIHTKQAPYRTYVIGMTIPSGSIPRALYWDTPHPYHYIRLAHRADGAEMLIVGGEDHKTGQADDTEERFGILEAWTRERFPLAGGVEFAWSGQVMEPVDSMGFIGKNPNDADNVFIITGDSGNGMTHGTIGGILITDLIAGRTNDWAALYDPSRITLRSAAKFAKENLNVAAQYADLATGGEIDSVDELAPGTGAIVRRGLEKIAAYRDDAGGLHELSAICTHLGCVVQWNSTEQTWDCPCHGSRFDPEGKVINGPAIKDLAAADSAGDERGAEVSASKRRR